jgi:general secretion pathway protein G
MFRVTRTLQDGYSFIELLVVVSILFVLASAALPLAQVASQRQREMELRRTLREMRTAIDKFKDAVDIGQIPTTELTPGSEGYPPDLETLVEGVTPANDASGRKLKFLRRVPIDPMTNSTEWGMRAYQDRPDSTSWGGRNVFDVYTKSQGTALDGTKYKDW